MTESTSNSIHITPNPNPDDFYKYAYTSLLRRRVIASCDKVISCGDELERAINELLRDMQEMIYNCTPDEVEAMKYELADPQQYATVCVTSVMNALNELRNYKLYCLTHSDKI